jgi:hypothetical protein
VTRYYYFWCERCPTRVTVETEAPVGAPDGEPQYACPADDGVGAVQTRTPTAHDDGMESAQMCPACGAQLRDLDSLVTYGEVPASTLASEASEAHAKWREESGN